MQTDKPSGIFQGWNRPQRYLATLLLSAVFAGTTHAQDTGDKTEQTTKSPSPDGQASPPNLEDKTLKTIKEPSPDGQFAFLETVLPGFEREGTVDLIAQKTGKVLRRVEEAINVAWSCYWAPDSKRVVVVSRVGHAIQGIDVYARRGASFQLLKMPNVGADVPKRLMRGKSFPHVASLHYKTVDKWTSNRTLAIDVATMFDGEGDSVMATRKVVFGFDNSDKIKVLKSSIKYESSHD